MKKETIAWISLIATFFLALLKILAGIIVKSASVLAEGLHSGMDVISSGITILGIRVAKKPVDEKHPYGHYKFEVLSGLIITIILFFTGVGIVYDALKRFMGVSELESTYVGLIVMGVSTVVNWALSKAKISIGKKEGSISLITDGVHSRVDVYVSFAVFFGLLLNPFWGYADALFALLVGLFIIKESFSLGKEATDSLLDVSAGEEIEDKIKEIVKKKKIELADLKTQTKGSIYTANLKLKLPAKISVGEATKISNNLRKKLMEEIDKLKYVAIQVEGHDIEENYYQPEEIFGFGKGFGWQRKGRFMEKFEKARGEGPGGYCVCPKCKYRVKHKRGVPCSTIKCPKCGASMVRD